MVVKTEVSKKLQLNLCKFVYEDGVLYIDELDAKSGEVIRYNFLQAFYEVYDTRDYVNITIVSKELIE